MTLPKDFDLPGQPIRWRQNGGMWEAEIVVNMPDPAGSHLPSLKATRDAPSLYPHAPKRTQHE